MIVFTIALNSRYDFDCGAFAFVLIVTLEISGQRSVSLLLARVWETIPGAVLGVGGALLARFLFVRGSRKRRWSPAMVQGWGGRRLADLPTGSASNTGITLSAECPCRIIWQTAHRRNSVLAGEGTIRYYGQGAAGL
jgi:hypothetical protein